MPESKSKANAKILRSFDNEVHSLLPEKYRREDRQILSIESQIQEIKDFAQKQNLEVIEFATEAKTAKIPGRLVFEQVLKRIEKGEAQGIVSWHPDRLARNSVDGGRIVYFRYWKTARPKIPIFLVREAHPKENLFSTWPLANQSIMWTICLKMLKRGLRQQ